MRVPLEWLHEYCAPDLSAFALADRLAMTGTEVERVERHGVSALENFVVGKVVEARQHPDADRLQRLPRRHRRRRALARSSAARPTSPPARRSRWPSPGAVMPDGTKLKVAKLRGQAVQRDDPRRGRGRDRHRAQRDHGPAGRHPRRHAAGARSCRSPTDVLVLEVTPNRPDCLGIYGVAREVHAATGAPLAPPPWADAAPGRGRRSRAATATSSDRRRGPDLCPRFTARAFEDVKIGPSPAWLKARLMAAGQRPISNIVDITNYVMLLTGQPLHAFDLDRIAGAQLTVRRARDGETHGHARRPDPHAGLRHGADRRRRGPHLDRRDHGRRPFRGGADDHAGAHRGRQLGRRQHPPHLAQAGAAQRGVQPRFEKQLQPEQAMEAQAIATRLMVELCGARARARDDRHRRRRARRPRRSACATRGSPGCSASRSRARAAPRSSRRCEFDRRRRRGRARRHRAGLPPRRRHPGGRPDRGGRAARRAPGSCRRRCRPATARAGRLTDVQRLRRRAADALTAQGLHEIVGWSFEGPDLAERLRIAGRPSVELENPMSATSRGCARRCWARCSTSGSATEPRGPGGTRSCSRPARSTCPRPTGAPDEPHHVAGLLSGAVRPATWRRPDPPAADFFAAKGVLGGLLDAPPRRWAL